MKYIKMLRSTKGLLCLLFLSALMLRVITVVVLNIHPESDYEAYQKMAQNLLAGNGLSDGLNKAFMSAGYPLFILVPTFALTGNSLLAAQLANAFLSAVSTLLCYFVARQAGADRTSGLISASLFALYIPSWIYAEYLAKENLMTPLMLGVVWCALSLSKQYSYAVTSVCGLLLGLLALTGNAALSIACAVLLALVFSKMTLNRKMFSLVTIVMIAVVIISPWLARNYFEVGAPVINSNSGFNLYLGNNPSATGYFVSIADTPIGEKWQSLRADNGELAASKILGKLALDWIQTHPLDVIMLSLKKAVIFWTPPVHSGKGDNSKIESISRLVWLVQFMILVVASVASLTIKNLRTKRMAILWSVIVGYTAVHMIFYVVFRYREPIMPFLCILSGFALREIMLLVKMKMPANKMLEASRMRVTAR